MTMTSPHVLDEPSAPTAAAAAVNEAIRRYVRAHGRRPWSPAERAELQRLRAAWLSAIRPDRAVAT